MSRFPVVRLVLLAAACALAGCKTTQTAAEPVAGVPTPFKLELQVMQEDGRKVYYVLDTDGTLHFAGGRDAGVRATQPAGKITADQARELWRIIESEGLLEADGMLFPKAQRVRYAFSCTAGRESAGYSTIDDRVPALAELDERLMAYQADLRYGNIDRSIDEAVQRGDGAVKKQ